MALSGTLETFSLPDVLRLLASTKKSGLLEVTGDRGDGHVWVADGDVVAAQTAGAHDVVGAVFGLLRFSTGSFEFDAGATTDDAGDPRPVEDVLAEAETLLEEWREIEAVVPSLGTRFRLVDEIDEVASVTPATWRIVAGIGGGCAGTQLARRLELSELDASRELRTVIEAGLVEIDDRSPAEIAKAAAAGGPDPATEAARTIPDFEPPAFAAGTIGSEDWQPPERLGPDAVTEDPWATPEVDDADTTTDVDSTTDPDLTDEPAVIEAAMDDPVTLDEAAAPFAAVTTEPVESVDPVVAPEGEEPAAGDDDGFLSELSRLSPKSAAAIEAIEAGDEAAESADGDFLSSLVPGTPEGGGATDETIVDDAEVPATDAEMTEDVDAAATDPEPADDSGRAGLDQNLLLRFLSSSKP